VDGRDRGIVLITGHRRESFGEGFESICEAIAALADRFPDCQFIYPVHLNPNVREPVFRILGAFRKASAEAGAGARVNVHLIEPVPYLSFVRLMDMATIILTDSGGIQEEAPSLGKPVLVMRETTERPEALETGLVQLVGTDRVRIVAEATKLLRLAVGQIRPTHSSQGSARRYPNPYGDGKAAERIVAGCAEFLTRPQSRA
jgi:UDP-N-acetylglucosamine 2-epimerase (non-hydrolysing)